ncbi:MAG: hypothetical protein JKY95_08055, partial [Planctomycetaceae bacterium]|nr:hypothetical protein [Planctomycetaceae bacterium]
MIISILLILSQSLTQSAFAQPTEAEVKAESAEAIAAAQAADKADQHRRNVAVALNYCKASFHRIRKYPSPIVMQQERQKILNNLNLSVINDAEIIRLYSDVLAEIGQIQISEKETDLYDVKYKKALRQEMAFDALSLGLNLMTASYLGAAKTGASSWWDYRNLKWTRDNEVLKLEKSRATSVVRKSTLFMDTFWRLTKTYHIPDRWLIRSNDLDGLEMAMNERDPQVRLRILKRMEPFMECYPPYWYYVARTQQIVGKLFESMATYERLATLEEGHFRRDDMLATALANRAVIQAHLGQQLAAVESAKKALAQSAEVWEANLACAQILQRAGQLADAEDAILRNLDVGLEREQSTVTLLTFYYDTNNTTKLAKYLSDEKVIAYIPPPVLIRFASRLPKHQTPAVVWTALASSMRIEPQMKFGEDSIVMVCHPVWKIDRSKIALHFDGRIIEGQITHQKDADIVRFENVAELGGILSGNYALPGLKLNIQYGDKDPIQLAFSGNETPANAGAKEQKNRIAGAERGYHLVA